MAIVLGALGAFLYVRLDRSLTTGLNETLELRATGIAAGLRDTAAPIDLWPAGEEGLAQVLAADGSLEASSPPNAPALVSVDEIARARSGAFTVRRDAVAFFDGEPARLLLTPVRRADEDVVLVVGASLEDREDALRTLLDQLLVIGPLALVLTSVGGYFLAAAALRPVESMRREAEVVSAMEPGRRLTLPPAKDEIRRLGETLNSMLGRLETALERERRFVADASHELRTPLSMLRTELELALRRERTPAELEQALRSASEETERLSQLAEDLLVLARVQGGSLPVRRERVSAHDLLDALRERYGRRASDNGREIEARADSRLTMFVDRLRIEQALGNLIDNALRHGGGRIVVEAKSEDSKVEVHVRDEGAGFPPGFVEHAFEPFSRGDDARTGVGAGLGLAIVDVVARAHGGSAHAGNVEGGADVWIVLPATPT